MEIIKEHKDNLCHIMLRNDGILEVATFPNIEYGEEESIAVMTHVIKIAAGKQYKVLIESGNYSTVTTDTLKLLASEKAMSYAIAKAYVIYTISQRIMSNFYKRFYNPSKPVRFFKTKQEAENWLLSLESIPHYLPEEVLK